MAPRVAGRSLDPLQRVARFADHLVDEYRRDSDHTCARHRWVSTSDRSVGRQCRTASAHDRDARCAALGFVVFHDVPLPKPSVARIDHLVVGPRSVWAVTAASYTDAVVAGTGRGADTLWAGRTPLRSVLERCETHADVLATVFGHPVEPMLCIDAPSLPQPRFDFHGITISSPDELAKAVATT